MQFKNISKNKIIKINLFRIISYLMLYGIFGVGNFVFFRSYVLLSALIVFAIIPVFSIIFVNKLEENMSVGLYGSDNQVYVGNQLGVGLIIENSSIFSSLSLNCILTISNTYYGEKSIQNISVPVVAKTTNKNPILCETCSCGIINIALNTFELSDVLGFVKIIKASDEKIAIIVYPKPEELDEIQKIGVVSGYADNEDATKQGNEYSDTSNIREYIPGDRIKDIHWKLSSKRDILLVKEHIRTCENKLLIWIDYSANKVINEKILRFVSSVTQYCISENIYLKYVWLSIDGNTINEAAILNNDDMIKAYENIFETSCKSRVANIQEVLYQNQINTNKIIRIGYSNSEVGIHVYEI